MTFRLMDFAPVMFKVCGIIGISKIEFLRFSDKELNTFFFKWNIGFIHFIGNKMYNNQGLTNNELIAVKVQSGAEAQMI